MTDLVITPCGARKLTQTARADRLYTGPYFRACMRYARTLAPLHAIRILSAKHGLVAVDRVLDPYELRFGMPGSVTVTQLRGQAKDHGLLDASSVVVLGGLEYTALALGVWPHATTPLADLPGDRRMGYQLAALARWTREAAPCM